MPANPAAIHENLLAVKSEFAEKREHDSATRTSLIEHPISNMEFSEEQLDLVAGGASWSAVIDNSKSNSTVASIVGRDPRRRRSTW